MPVTVRSGRLIRKSTGKAAEKSFCDESATRTGGPGANVFAGTDKPDRLAGRGGDDKIFGKAVTITVEPAGSCLVARDCERVLYRNPRACEV